MWQLHKMKGEKAPYGSGGKADIGSSLNVYDEFIDLKPKQKRNRGIRAKKIKWLHLKKYLFYRLVNSKPLKKLEEMVEKDIIIGVWESRDIKNNWKRENFGGFRFDTFALIFEVEDAEKKRPGFRDLQ